MKTISSGIAALTLASALRATDDSLAGLGLDDFETGAPEAPAEPAAAETVTEVVATEEAKAAREEVKIGELEYGVFDSIPTVRRGGGASGSKYKFEDIKAPVAKADGSGFSYSYSLVRLVEGEDADKLKRSVQSATNQANAAAKKDGAVERFINRQFIEKGEYAGTYIIRVDGTQDEETAAE